MDIVCVLAKTSSRRPFVSPVFAADLEALQGSDTATSCDDFRRVPQILIPAL